MKVRTLFCGIMPAVVLCACQDHLVPTDAATPRATHANFVRILESESDQPVVGATAIITLDRTSFETILRDSDGAGWLLLPEARATPYAVVRALGYRPFVGSLEPGGDGSTTIRLERGELRREELIGASRRSDQ